MSDVFGHLYAKAYDALYQDKDYDEECNLIEQLILKHSQRPVKSILDLGCGTGNHTLPLARRGYHLTAVDRSEAMLTQAQSKVDESMRLEPRFCAGDLRDVRLGMRFDACLMMFAVLGYQLENSDVARALHNVREHLEPGGVVLFDVWYGPAVLHQVPSNRTKTASKDTLEIVRVASAALDLRRNRCSVKYELRLREGGTPAMVQEEHVMRYFFEPELDLFLSQSRLNLVHCCSFPDVQHLPSQHTWNILCIAKAM